MPWSTTSPRCNANHGGVFATSQESDRILDDAHAAVADLLNAPSPDEIVFGANMTTLTLHLSRAIGQHAASRATKSSSRDSITMPTCPLGCWLRAMQGRLVRHVDIRPADCTLDLDDLRRQLSAAHPAGRSGLRFQRGRHGE